jgi:hypothetical protein
MVVIRFSNHASAALRKEASFHFKKINGITVSPCKEASFHFKRAVRQRDRAPGLRLVL